MAILPSHKEGVLYLEHCAVRSSDDRLAFIRRKEAVEQHFSLPLKNVAVLLLGPGTSITQQAARLCAEGQLLLGFCAGGATPIYLAALNEYREPRHSRDWITMWGDEQRRHRTAVAFQLRRAALLRQHWPKALGSREALEDAIARFERALPLTRAAEDLLVLEAQLTKDLYALAARGGAFSRQSRSADGGVNDMLDASNYLAYGLGAVCLWVLGVPFSYPVVHGKTRRGALVFDVADIVKDSLVLPNVFLSAAARETASTCRARVIAALHDANALAIMFDAVLDACSSEKKGMISFSQGKRQHCVFTENG
jgi:CRISPR-associated protein Cas1